MMVPSRTWRSTRAAVAASPVLPLMLLLSAWPATAEASPAIHRAGDNSDVLKELGVDIQNEGRRRGRGGPREGPVAKDITKNHSVTPSQSC